MAGRTEENPDDLINLKMALQNHLEKQLVKGDTWYLIDYDQLEQCKKVLGFEGTMYNDSFERKGSIDNGTLFENSDSSEIREHMTEGIDYALVPDEGWNLLVEQFGLKEGQDPIARKVIEHGMFVKHLKVEVYFYEFQLAENYDLGSVLKKKFSRSDTLGDIEKVMREEFHIEERVETRLWNKYTSNTYEQLSRLEKTVQDAGLFNGQLIIIEQRNEDGTWPRQTRQIQAENLGETVEVNVDTEVRSTDSGGEKDKNSSKNPNPEGKHSSIKELADKEINNVKDSVRHQYLTKIEEINTKISDEEKNVEIWNGKREDLKRKQTREKKTLEKKHKDEKATMEEKHKMEEADARKKYGNDGLYLASLREIRKQLSKDIDKLDMEPDKDNKNLEDARGELECPICLEAMKPPVKIWMCPLSHIICELCKNKLEGGFCPSCRTNQVTQRAIFVENLAKCVFNQ